MQGDTSFGASTTSPPSIAKSKVDPSETPSPLQQPSPSTSNSNIYPALKNMAANLLHWFLCSANISTTNNLGDFQSLHQSKTGGQYSCRFQVRQQSKNNGGGLQLVDFGSALYSLPLKWGNLSRCFGEFSTGVDRYKTSSQFGRRRMIFLTSWRQRMECLCFPMSLVLRWRI